MPEATAPARTGLSVLVVDGDATIAQLVLQSLHASRAGTAKHVDTGRAALDSLTGVDVVLLDHHLPDASGLAILETIRARPHPPAVVMVTAHGNERLAASALRLGADDYLPKDAHLAELLPQVLERIRRARELRKALGAAERDLVRAERLAAIGEMTVTLHHGINNPLMSASTEVELLLSEPGMPEPLRRQTLEGIRDSLYRIRDIVRQIGDLRTIRTKSYLPGIQMVDLDGGPPAAELPQRGIALVQLPDEDLARVVVLLLRHAGWQTERCGSLEDLRRGVGRLGVTLVIVAGASDAAGSHPLGGFVPAAGREYRVVALVTGDGAAARTAGADRVIALPFDPGGFTEEMVSLVS